MKLAPTIIVATLAFAAAAAAQPPPQPAAAGPAKPMQRVDGIGGFFFRSKSPKTLAQWYEDHLGVTQVPTDYNQQPWRQSAGPTAFQPFRADSTYFGPVDHAFVLNFRVKDLDAMVTQLRGDGIVVEVDPKTYPNGRFALTHDPEGNPIQLWQLKP